MKKLILFFALTTMIALSGCGDPDYYDTYFNIENATQDEITVDIEIGKIIIPPGETKLIHTAGDYAPPPLLYTFTYTILRLGSMAAWYRMLFGETNIGHRSVAMNIAPIH